MPAAFIPCAAAATLALVLAGPFAPWAQALAAAWIGGAALHANRKLSRVAALEIGCDGAVAVRDGRGAWRTGVLRGGSFAAPWLAIVRWRPEAARFDRTLLILPGMAPPEARRAIRVILRFA